MKKLYKEIKKIILKIRKDEKLNSTWKSQSQTWI